MAATRGPGVVRARVCLWRRRGWAVPRIAEKLGVAEQTVYYHLHRLEADGELENAVKRYRRRAA
jgi:predicted ArsR family transcriptional regulator